MTSINPAGRLDDLLLRWEDGTITPAQFEELVSALQSAEGRRAAADHFCFNEELAAALGDSRRATSAPSSNTAVAPVLTPAIRLANPRSRSLRRRLTIGALTGGLAAAACLLIVVGPRWRTSLLPDTRAPAIASVGGRNDPADSNRGGGSSVATPAGGSNTTSLALARLVEMDGKLELVSPAGDATPAQLGQPLLAGQTLRTVGDNGFAAVEYPDRTRVELGGETTVRFPADAGRRLTFGAGMLRAEVTRRTTDGPAGDPIVVCGPQVEVRVEQSRGAKFLLCSGSGDATRVDLDAGDVELVRHPSRGSPADSGNDPRSRGAVALRAGYSAVTGPNSDGWLIEPLPTRLTDSRARFRMSSATAAVFAADGSALLAANSRALFKWPLAGGMPTADGEHVTWMIDRPGERGHAAFSADRATLVTCPADGTVRVWDVPTGRPRLVLGEPGPEVSVIAVAPDGRWVLAADPRPGRAGMLRRWDAISGKELGSVNVGGRAIRCLALSPDGRLLAAGIDADNKDHAHRGRMLLWDTRTWQAAGIVPADAGSAHQLAFSPDGQVLASAADDGTVRLWNVRADSSATDAAALVPGLILTATTGPAACVLTFSPDGRLLAAGTRDGRVWLWDLAAGGRPRAVYTAGRQWVWALAFAPDGRSLATGAHKSPVQLWDIPPATPPAPPPAARPRGAETAAGDAPQTSRVSS